MKKIDGVARPLIEILKGNKFAIDYYQREYRWESKQLHELVGDLVDRFDEAWRPTHERHQVERYPYYFLGSIILSEKDGTRYIVDGQQRLTSLTLLLTYLRRLQESVDDAERVFVDDLILSVRFGRKSFNLDVADRKEAMAALFERGEYVVPPDASPSVSNLVARYEELADLLPAEVHGERLPFFLDWLLYRLQLVQITAYADEDAYAIFETMNDRGLKLTPADMMKGFVLAHIGEGEPRATADSLWRRRARELADRDRDAESDFLKTWLRSQYALRIRERRKAAQAEDWDRIGTEFHRWLKDDAERIGLAAPASYRSFVIVDLDFYARQYSCLLDAASWANVPPGLEYVGYNADQGFTLQHQLLLAPLRTGDAPHVVATKMRLVAMYVDVLLTRRIWNFRSIAYSSMQYAMFVVMRDIRSLEVGDLARHLFGLLRDEVEDFGANPRLRLHQQNRYQLHRLLARMTDYVATESGEASRYLELTNRRDVRYEIEHIWANRPEHHSHEFAHEHDFREQRDRIGDLLLVPKPINASYGDAPYAEKLPHYVAQNLLARSLHPNAYQHERVPPVPGTQRDAIPRAPDVRLRRHRRARRSLPGDREAALGPAEAVADRRRGADVSGVVERRYADRTISSMHVANMTEGDSLCPRKPRLWRARRPAPRSSPGLRTAGSSSSASRAPSTRSSPI